MRGLATRLAPLAAGLGVLAAALPAAAGQQSDLVERGHEGWCYWDKGGRPPEGWRAAGFDDARWGTGAAPLGYGADGVATTIGFGEDDDNKHAAAFFRLTFDVADPAAYPVWLGELRCDDGAVVYLNGAEVYRYNMPAGDPTEATFASGEFVVRQLRFQPFHIEPGHLVAGQNVVAIREHQFDAGSDDLLMDFGLKQATQAVAPEVKPLRSDGVFQEDAATSRYIGRWAKHLLRQHRAPNPTRLRAGLNRMLDRESKLLEPSEVPLSPNALYERCAPGVLIISSVMDADADSPGSSSGFIISADGLALTNHHVMQAVNFADIVVATTFDGRVVRVKEVLASSEDDDLALIQLDGDGVQPMPIAKSVPVGAELVAITHPAGSDGLMNEFFLQTRGHLARYRTFFGQLRAMVTTGYSLGSSGGPILDRFGSVACVVSKTRSFVATRVDVHAKDGAIMVGKGKSSSYHLAMNHQMALGIAVPWQTIRSFLTLQPLGSAQSVEAREAGLDWSLFEGAWNTIPDFAALEPADRGTCKKPAADVHGGRTDEYGLVFTGFVDLPRDGAWRFGTTSDDGSRLFVDGQLVVDNDGLHGPVERTGSRRLAAGLHELRVEFFELHSGEELKVHLSGPGQPWGEIPASALRRR